MTTKEQQQQIEKLRIKRILDTIDQAQGKGTSMVTLYIPTGAQISRYSKKINEEYRTATQIKSRINRQSVQDALRSMKAKLGRYNTTPPNGLVLFVGYYENKDGKNKLINYGFEPYQPLQQSLYYCGSNFQTEMLREQIGTNSKSYGFLLIDGAIASFHELSGSNRRTLFKFDKAELPKKHGRGGQSQNRFARLRLEKRDWYTTKIAEFAVMHFIDSKTSKPTVDGLILAGLADLKYDLGSKLDIRLKNLIITYIDIQYSGEAGFSEAIEKSEGFIETIEYTKEKKIISRLFEHISRSTELYCYGLKETMYALISGCVDQLIVWNELPFIRIEAKSKTDEEKTEVFYLKSDKEPIDDNWEIVEEIPLLDWVLEHYRDFGSNIELVSDQSSEGNQFVVGFGGLGAILRYPVVLTDDTVQKDNNDNEDDEDEEGSIEIFW